MWSNNSFLFFGWNTILNSKGERMILNYQFQVIDYKFESLKKNISMVKTEMFSFSFLIGFSQSENQSIILDILM